MAPDNRVSRIPGWLRGRSGALVFLMIATIAVGYFVIVPPVDQVQIHRFTKVTRGPIESVVSASGSVQPVVTVIVGSQASGQVSELLADFNSTVKAGDVIARLDPAVFEARVWQAKAELRVSEANIAIQEAARAEAVAAVEGARSAGTETQQDLKRKKALLKRKVVSPSVVDKAVAVNEQAAARLRAAEAKLRNQRARLDHAKALVEEKQAALKQRQIDLDNTIIRSPVDGVVIARQVDVGQTVAASLQAPTLFTIAKDLRQMQVEVSVDEADIGKIIEGQRATFTVDSYADREFEGRVTQIRKAPTEISNVVTYTAVVSADNGDFSLLPGMTANVSFIIGTRANALKVENRALRFRPKQGSQTASKASSKEHSGGSKRLQRVMRYLTQELRLSDDQQQAVRSVYEEIGKRGRAMRAAGVPGDEVKTAVESMREQSRKQVAMLLDEKQRKLFWEIIRAKKRRTANSAKVWVVNDFGLLRPVAIKIGLTDGVSTEIVGGNLSEGQPVVVSEVKPAEEGRKRWRLGF